MIKAIERHGDAVRLIDQTLLPGELVYRDLRTVEEVWEAIKGLRVRGAPAIGIAGAMGMYIGVAGKSHATVEDLLVDVDRVARYLASVRPTAYNLFWAIERVRERANAARSGGVQAVLQAMRDESDVILEEDRRQTRRMGEHALRYIREGSVILTHCNTGALATGGIGTALAGVYMAEERGLNVKVYACETRPLLQGARLTSWELMQAGVDVTLITDSTAAHVMRDRGVDMVMLGADRIARNGDTANKIGTYQHAVTAEAHRIPFYVVAPVSTIDPGTPNGADIRIEERDPAEITEIRGQRIAPAGAKVYNPAFDVTPASLITALITDEGVAERPTEEKILSLCGALK